MTTWLARIFLFAFGASNAALFLGTIWVGWDYYAAPDALRGTHPDHLLFGPGGSWGVLLGCVGTFLMTVMLLYSVRRFLRRVRWLGSIATWLNFHILCGIFGPLHIVAHAGFSLPSGLIAVGFWCMVVVALSGVFGRYVHGLLPRVPEGSALGREDALEHLADLRAQLVAQTVGAHAENVSLAVHLVRDFDHEATSLVDLWSLNRDLSARRRQIRRLLNSADLSRAARNAASMALSEQLRLKRGLEASRIARRLLRYWHLFHRPLAAAMYVIVALHIASAVLLGGSLARLMELF